MNLIGHNIWQQLTKADANWEGAWLVRLVQGVTNQDFNCVWLYTNKAKTITYESGIIWLCRYITQELP